MVTQAARSARRGRVNFDRMAQVYRWLEYLSFGPVLEQTRMEFLPRLTQARQALVLGDGDGRFLAALLEANRTVRVDAVDSSGAMLRLAEQRIRALPQGEAGAGALGRVRFHRADALGFVPKTRDYDLMVAHFFLDCFEGAELEGLMRRLSAHLAARARLVVSDFAVPQRGAMRPLAGAIVGGLYRVFGMLTGLRVRRLPRYDSVLTRCGFRLVERRERLFGLLVSELWAFGAGDVGEATGGVRAHSQGG